MDTDKIFFNMGRVSLEKTLSQWNELYSRIKGSSIFVKKNYCKYSIRSRPCIILNPNFSKLVLKSLHKLWLSFNEFSKVGKCIRVYKIPCLKCINHF